MLSKRRKAKLFVMLAFLFGLFVPAGWIMALPTASAQGPTLRSPSNTSGVDCDFALQHQLTIQSRSSPTTETVTIGDQVWHDVNENGIQDAFPHSRSQEGSRVPRTGVPGVHCILCELGKAAPVGSTFSNAKGHYSFTLQLSEAATYYVVVQPPEGYDFTIKDVNNNQNDVVDSDVDPTTGRTDNFTVQPGSPNDTLDVGLVDTPEVQTVTMALSPSEITTGIGQSFEVNIEVQVDSVDQVMEEAWAFLNFDPTVLQVSDITPGGDLPSVFRNSFDNDQGHIDFAATKPTEPFPSDTFTLATVSFTTLIPTDGTYIQFNHETPRISDVTFDSRSVLSTTVGNMVKIVVPTAIDSVTFNGEVAQSSAPWGGWLALLTLSVTILLGWRRRRG